MNTIEILRAFEKSIQSEVAENTPDNATETVIYTTLAIVARVIGRAADRLEYGEE